MKGWLSIPWAVYSHLNFPFQNHLLFAFRTDFNIFLDFPCKVRDGRPQAEGFLDASLEVLQLLQIVHCYLSVGVSYNCYLTAIFSIIFTEDFVEFFLQLPLALHVVRKAPHCPAHARCCSVMAWNMYALPEYKIEISGFFESSFNSPYLELKWYRQLSECSPNSCGELDKHSNRR